MFTLTASSCEISDLIETLWNVKKKAGAQLLGNLGFNRDIVECKDGYDYNRVQKCVRFNRDIVECKVVVLYEKDVR